MASKGQRIAEHKARAARRQRREKSASEVDISLDDMMTVLDIEGIHMSVADLAQMIFEQGAPLLSYEWFEDGQTKTRLGLNDDTLAEQARAWLKQKAVRVP